MRLTPDEYNHKTVLATIFTPNVYDSSVPEGRIILARQELIYTIGYWSYDSLYDKVGRVFAMVVISILSHAEFGRNDHREDAPRFIIFSLTMAISRWNCFSVKFEYPKIASYDLQESHIVGEFRDIWDSLKNLAAKMTKLRLKIWFWEILENQPINFRLIYDQFNICN